MARNKKYELELVGLLARIIDPRLMRSLLEDLLTPSEFDALVLRLELVKMLEAGVPQREIAKKLGVGIAKVTRGSRVLQKKNSALKKIL